MLLAYISGGALIIPANGVETPSLVPGHSHIFNGLGMRLETPIYCVGELQQKFVEHITRT